MGSALVGTDERLGHPAAASRPLLILVDSLARSTREYLLESIAARYDIWLFQRTAPTWEVPYIVGHTVVDTLDGTAMAGAADGLGAAGVLCWDEVRIEAASVLAWTLGLPGGDPQAVRRCRDKHLTRTALAAAAVPQPESVAVADLAQAQVAARHFGYPVVLKPRALAGSYGVVKVESAAGLAEAFGHARSTSLAGVPSFDYGVLVEEYADGEEISIDVVCASGSVTPLFLARKQLGFPPYFEETGHIVDSADPLLESGTLRGMLADAHAAVGLATGWTHTEIRLTERGPKLVEINARLGGDMIPYLGMLATGINPGLAAAAVACGLPPPMSADRHGAAGIRFLYPPRDIVAGQVTVDAARLPPAVDVVKVLATPGQELRLPPRGHISSRFAYVIATGQSAVACADMLEIAAAAIQIREAASGQDGT